MSDTIRHRRRRRLWLSPEEFSNLANTDESDDGTTTTTTTTATTIHDDDDDNSNAVDTYERLFDRFSSKPQPKSLLFLLSNTVVVGQEFVLTGLVLAGHRATMKEEEFYHHQQRQRQQKENDFEFRGIQSDRLLVCLGLVWLTLVVSVIENRFATSAQYKIRHRLTDFLLMAILLRMSSAVLKTLTHSYSSNTVYALSVTSLLLHLLACDYAYANGMIDHGNDDDDSNNDDNDDESNHNNNKNIHDKNHDDGTGSPRIVSSSSSSTTKRPKFKGGIVSLTSAFFATTLLASRLESNAAVYVFVCSSVVLFALFPASRHMVALKSTSLGGVHRLVPVLITAILSLALIVLLDPTETVLFSITISIILIVVPIWKYRLQHFKVILRGPWDIAHV